jgi:hypothetical protein
VNTQELSEIIALVERVDALTVPAPHKERLYALLLDQHSTATPQLEADTKDPVVDVQALDIHRPPRKRRQRPGLPPRAHRLYDYLMRTGPSTAVQVADALGEDRRCVSSTLGVMCLDQRILERTHIGDARQPGDNSTYVYRVAEQPPDFIKSIRHAPVSRARDTTGVVYLD